jgi:uncharacterized protein
VHHISAELREKVYSLKIESREHVTSSFAAHRDRKAVMLGLSSRGVSQAERVHEFRDPVHVFIKATTQERRLIDSWPVQRLRHVHQLALTHLLYPGAVHSRLEHALGTMELATRIYESITQEDKTQDPAVSDLLPRKGQHDDHYWKRVVRLGALLHDVGHLPFSHGPEDLLPDGWSHEKLSQAIILGDDLAPLFESLKVNPSDIAKIAVGPKYYKEEPFSPLEHLLTEIVTGDAFGADRIDYLLRDSHHAGVQYGRFDHHRLIDTLRILPQEGTSRLVLGVEEGGLHSAEALLLARFFMRTQLYYHHIRRIYDIHLKEFLSTWLPAGKFSVDLDDHRKLTDLQVLAAMAEAAEDEGNPAHHSAKRIVHRDHFKLLYQRDPDDYLKNPQAAQAVYAAAVAEFGKDKVRYDSNLESGKSPRNLLDFPMLIHGQKVVSARKISEILRAGIPVVDVEFVFISSELRDDAMNWLKSAKQGILVGQTKENEK